MLMAMSDKMRVRLILVNWNGGDKLAEAVEAARKSLAVAGVVAEIVVVDNGSADVSLEWSRGQAYEGRLTLVELGKNTGFGHACNVGAKGFAGDYLLFLNPDTRVEPSSIGDAIAAMEADHTATIGIVGIKNVGDDGRTLRTCARFPSPLNFLSDALGIAPLAPHIFPGIHLRDFDHEISAFVDHVIGAFYFVRSDLFFKLNGFDERFFVYLEDLDFSVRAAREGYRCYFLAKATMYHKGGGVSEKVKDLRLFYSLRSRILYGFKHFDWVSAWLVTVATLCVEPWPRLLRGALRGSAEELVNTFKAFGMLYRDFPAIVAAARCVA
jgi:N-acetylglucosaminyl-diphospho-decaprenol L-rhamnosyltransferase